MGEVNRNNWLVGSWKLLSLSLLGNNNSPIFPLGKKPDGIITYSDAGDMQLHYEPFKMPDFENIFDLEANIFKFAKFALGPCSAGKYLIHENLIIHLIKSSFEQNYSETSINWSFKYVDDKLMLSRIVSIQESKHYEITCIWQKL